MIGDVIAVGIHQGRWMFVTRLDNTFVYGRVWSSVRARWSQRDVFYPREAIDRKRPLCVKPLLTPASTETVCAESDSGQTMVDSTQGRGAE